MKTENDARAVMPDDADFLATPEQVAHELPKMCPGCRRNYARSEEAEHFAACEDYIRWEARPKLTVAAFKPIGDRVVVKLIPEADVTSSGLELAQTAVAVPLKGEVLAAGPGRPFDNGSLWPMQVAPGDIVAFQKHSGETIRIGDEEVMVFREDELMGVWPGAAVS